MIEKPSQMAHPASLEKPNDQKTPSLPVVQEPKEISNPSNNEVEQGRTSAKSHKDEESSSHEEMAMDGQVSVGGDGDGDGDVDQGPMNVSDEALAAAAAEEEDSGRERLKKRKVEVAGQVWIPDIWGQEELLQDWIDCSAFDASLFPRGIMSARSALVEEGRRENSGRLRIENRC